MIAPAIELQHMDKSKNKPLEPGENSPKAKRKQKTKTVQIAEDVAFWAGRLAELEESTIWKVLDPVREILREQLRTNHDLDPDEEWQLLLRSRNRRNGKEQQS